ncbi:MAG: pilus assembly protein [Anaerolineaceae bacterium]|nr:pilus assembly protein [Anaerolineaceae bacterium]
MRRLLKTILEILDGTPAVYGDRRRGQSVAELALVTPLLIILLMGLAEVGWFASNYISLLEVTRTGARYGTVQTGYFSPLEWNNNYTEFPPLQPQPPAPPIVYTPEELIRAQARSCDDIQRDELFQGFFNLLSCVMLQSMDPLQLRTNGADDIVVSAFALQAIDRDEMVAVDASHNPTTNWTTNLDKSLFPITQIPKDQRQVLVVGRWPVNANECNYDDTGASAQGERDPFDYIQSNQREFWLRNTALPDTENNRAYYELLGMDVFDPGNPEDQVGFVYYGQHVISDSNGRCTGSEWSIREVETLMNGIGFSLNDPQRDMLPNQGMVLVELFWQHELLLKNPVFNPVFTILGDSTIIYVWSAFPVPAVEPHIQFN